MPISYQAYSGTTEIKMIQLYKARLGNESSGGAGAVLLALPAKTPYFSNPRALPRGHETHGQVLQSVRSARCTT
jgi:hypothetical protein